MDRFNVVLSIGAFVNSRRGRRARLIDHLTRLQGQLEARGGQRRLSPEFDE
jgi:hypothetical protein